MSGARRGFLVYGTLLALSSLPLFAADTPPAGPNSDPTYQQLRNIGFGNEAVAVANLDLHREGATFHLRSGTLCFLAPVQGKITGAVFTGDGNLVIEPPIASERTMLRLLTKENEFSENFDQAVFRFTDSTYDELKRTANSATGICDAGALKDSQNALRSQLRYNLHARILQDVLGAEHGGLFVAFIPGKRYSGKMVYAVDPHGAPPLAETVYRGEFPEALNLSPEEVELMTYQDNKHGYWASFHFSQEYKDGTASGAQKNGVIEIEHQQLDTTIDINGHLAGKASTSVVSRVSGLRVLPFDLYRTLRVSSVTGPGGEPLSFIQEDKNEDSQYFVILPKSLAAGEKYTLTTVYGGKDAVFHTGNGNYFPIARENWYPNTASNIFGSYTAYDLTFRIPKDMKMVATGDLISENNIGGQNVTVWKSETLQTVAGFNFGKFKMEEAKLTKPEYLVQSFANQEPPDWVQGIQQAISRIPPPQGRFIRAPITLGTMETTVLNKKALAEGEVAVQLYSDYFGPSSYRQVALTQQTACTFGQAWPQLIWIPICYFFDSTVRHQLGLERADRGYWKVVTPHEVAHQWWGHTVGSNSYRDEWMSEGFADFSAALYLQMVYSKEPNRYFDFWKDERELLTERDKEGFRAIDAGPLTMGYRLSNTRTGFGITRRLIYPKGAYVLHMIRMMMWDHQLGDQTFRETMQDFVKTYANKAATTEDFKAMVEKHMTREMDVEGSHRMDWFFNEYVFGTALPSYKLDYSFDKDPSGDVLFSFKVTQSGVDDHFRMIVPIYLDLDGRVVHLGRALITGNTSVEQKVPIRGLKTAPKRALLNYNYDVLASN